MLAWANPDVFLQIWIGSDDKLPRRIRAIYSADPSGLRHQMDLSNWQIDRAYPRGRIHRRRRPKARSRSSSTGRRARPTPPAGLKPLGNPQPSKADAGQTGAEVTLMRLNAMKAMIVIAAALLIATVWQVRGRVDLGQPVWRQHEPHLRADQPHQRLWRQLVAMPTARAPSTRTCTAAVPRTHMEAARSTRTPMAAPLWRLWRGRHAYLCLRRECLHPPGSVPYAGYPAYHPPVAVPYYAASGCYGCAAAAGAVVGVAAGAAAASANAAAANSYAYNAGVAAGAAASTPRIRDGSELRAVPGGCAPAAVRGNTFYVCGNTWFQPIYGANGVYYRVVPTP